MTDPLLDDVKALLDKDFGDDRILRQICRACEHDEIISNYERNYVRELSEKYLDKKPKFTLIPVEEKHVIPKVIIPETQLNQQIQSFQSPPKILYYKSKKKKIMFGIAGLALIIVIAAAVSFSGITGGIGKIDTSPSPISLSLSIQTDLESYNSKDLISISGISDITGTASLSITNQNNKLVWAEQIPLKSNGQFSTISIAGGLGWEKSGTYAVRVDNGKETNYSTFSFTAS